MAGAASAQATGTTDAQAESGEPRRRLPDGVAVDPATSVPPPADRAIPGAELVALRPDVSARQIRRLVARYFAAIGAEDIAALGALATDDATFSVPRPKGASGGLIDQWRTRFSHLAYRQAARTAPYDDDDLGVYSYDDLEESASGAQSSLPFSRPSGMAPGDLLVHVPVRDPRGAGGDRLFGDEVWLVLRRRAGGGLAVRQVLEDFQLP